jgi:hypothetical protein
MGAVTVAMLAVGLHIGGLVTGGAGSPPAPPAWC